MSILGIFRTKEICIDDKTKTSVQTFILCHKDNKDAYKFLSEDLKTPQAERVIYTPY